MTAGAIIPDQSRAGRPELLVLMLLFIIQGGALYTLPIVVSMLGAHTHLPMATIGLMVAAAAPVQMLLRIPGGVLPEIFGARRTMILAWTGGIVSGLCFVVAAAYQQTWLIFVAQLTYGLSASFFFPVAWSRASQAGSISPGRAIGLMAVGAGAGQLIGPLLSGAMVDQFGIAAPFWLYLGGMVLGMVLVLVTVPPSQGSGNLKQLVIGFPRAADVVRRSGDVRLAMVIEIAFFITFTTFQAYFPVVALSRGLTASHIGFLFALKGVAALAGRVLFTVIGGRIRADLLAVFTLAGCLALTGSLAFVTNYSWTMAIMAFGGLCYGLLLPDLIFLITRSISAADRTIAAALHGLCSNVGKFGGGVVGSLLVLVLPIPTVLLALSGATLAAALFATRLTDTRSQTKVNYVD
jgi:predicted MFS family arabinose efflux permease